jgi:NAD dependent epimerase/dehydratase family enzyme
MVSRHAVVAGASGFIGAALVTHLRRDGWRVTTLVRRNPATADEVRWDPAMGELDPAVVSGADAVINVAGSSISRMPWTKAIKTDLMESRRTTTTTCLRS